MNISHTAHLWPLDMNMSSVRMIKIDRWLRNIVVTNISISFYLPFLLKSFISYAPQIFQLLWSVVCLPTFGVKKLLNSEQTCLSRLLMKMFYKLLEWFGQWSKINLKQLKLKDNVQHRICLICFFWNVKDPQFRTIRDMTKRLKRRNSMFVRPVAPAVNFIYCLYVDKMFDQKQRAIISYFSITDVGSTEYHLKTPKYLFVLLLTIFRSCP